MKLSRGKRFVKSKLEKRGRKILGLKEGGKWSRD
jgi:hypothetical protein